jgi:hypothetical protein
MTDTSRTRQNEIEGWVGLVGAFGLIAGFAVFLYQLYLWLKLGQWISMPLSTVFQWLGFDYSSVTDFAWIGVQKLVVWSLDLPLSAMSIVAGFAIGYVVGSLVTCARELGKSVFPSE